MRTTTTGKGLLLGCVFALAASGCKDDNNNGPTDMGTDLGPTDMGTTDMGTDLGQVDMGPVDMGTDMGTPQPAYLRLAHLAFGTGVGTVHLCARNADGTGDYSLVTSNALLTGDFTHATVEAPIPYGTITRHIPLDPLTQSSLAGKVVYVFRQAEAGATFTAGLGGTSFGTCVPTGTALTSATLGTDIALAPGTSHTVAVVGSLGAELDTDCNGGACPAPQIVDLLDETAPVTGTPTTARTRIVNADPRFGAAPGFCSDFYGAQTPNPLPVTPIGLAPYAGGSTAPVYEDATPLLLTTSPLPDGGTTVVPRLLNLHTGGVAGLPCAPTTIDDGDGGVIQTPIMPAGILPNQELIAQFAAGAAMGAATVRAEIAPDINTTIFIAPMLLQWIETDTSSANVGMPCDKGSTVTCAPAGGVCMNGSDGDGGVFPLPSPSCTWVPISIPVTDLVTP